MKQSIREKLTHLLEKFDEISHQLASPSIISDMDRFRELSKEYAALEDPVKDFKAYTQCEDEIHEARLMADSDDKELQELGEEELAILLERKTICEESLKKHLIPIDPDDNANLYLEIRAGAGGDEAAIFAGDLFRMYTRYAEQKKWKVEVLSISEGDHGGYKEIISRLVGDGAYSKLKFESGAHRVQRIPETESQGRIHTSACTIAVLPESEDIEDIEINTSDLRVDTYRASGAGGQHVNKTDSAVRLTHIPSGIVVECQDERSQHKNRARALSLLKVRLRDEELAKRRTETEEKRRSLVGRGDRSERIRSYNFPEGRVTDHRIDLKIYKLNEILEGGLDLLIEPLVNEHQADQLSAIE
ncbi:MAG: peptide chain release factor 1 [Gammaproteobacteria bacterium TMED78]|nr:MAG: peptide chain release factor 1 [Gammaproteobacteria bacterium TMED78]